MSLLVLGVGGNRLVLSTSGAPSVPATPAGLTASAISTSAIDVSWSASTGATAYSLRRSTDLSTWTTLTPTGTSYGDTGLSASTTYYYEVDASNSAGTSAWSGPFSVATSSSGDPLSKTVLSSSNFTYLGTFKMPTAANSGWPTSFAFNGLAHRYVGGQLRFLTTNHVYSGGLVYETNYPGVATSGTIPQATVVANWGDIYSNHKWFNSGGSPFTVPADPATGLNGALPTYGLYYDQNLGRLYWSYGFWYNSTDYYNPSFGYSTLNDSTVVGTGIGAWGMTGRYEKFGRGGTTRIPQWFADSYTGGKTLGVGFGGYFSISGNASFGPALAAVADPDIAVNADRSSLANVPLIGYPATATDRCHRDPDYTSYYDDGVYPTTPATVWQPVGGVGYWTSSDVIYGGATWIDMPSLGGVLFIAKVGQGAVFYQSSDRHASTGAFEWFVYDPADLASVATGAKQQWQIQPKYHWIDANLSLNAIDAAGWSGDGGNLVGGVSFDPSTNRLYVLVASAWHGDVEWFPSMYVYQVA